MDTFLLLAGSAIAKVCAKGGHHAGHFFRVHQSKKTYTRKAKHKQNTEDI